MRLSFQAVTSPLAVYKLVRYTPPLLFSRQAKEIDSCWHWFSSLLQSVSYDAMEFLTSFLRISLRINYQVIITGGIWTHNQELTQRATSLNYYAS